MSTLTVEALRSLSPAQREALRAAMLNPGTAVKYRPLAPLERPRDNQPAPVMILGSVCPS